MSNMRTISRLSFATVWCGWRTSTEGIMRCSGLGQIRSKGWGAQKRRDG